MNVHTTYSYLAHCMSVAVVWRTLRTAWALPWCDVPYVLHERDRGVTYLTYYMSVAVVWRTYVPYVLHEHNRGIPLIFMGVLWRTFMFNECDRTYLTCYMSRARCDATFTWLWNAYPVLHTSSWQKLCVGPSAELAVTPNTTTHVW